MKQLLILFTAALLIAGMSACSGCGNSNDSVSENKEFSAKQKLMLNGLEHEIDKVNKELPIETGEGLTLSKMAIEDGYLVSTCTYKEGINLEIDDSAENKAKIIEAAGESAVKRLKDLDMGLKYVYIEEGTGKSQTITISPEEL